MGCAESVCARCEPCYSCVLSGGGFFSLGGSRMVPRHISHMHMAWVEPRGDYVAIGASIDGPGIACASCSARGRLYRGLAGALCTMQMADHNPGRTTRDQPRETGGRFRCSLSPSLSTCTTFLLWYHPLATCAWNSLYCTASNNDQLCQQRTAICTALSRFDRACGGASRRRSSVKSW